MVGNAVPSTEICPPATPECASETLAASVRPDRGCHSTYGAVPSTLIVAVVVAGLPAASLTVTVERLAAVGEPGQAGRFPALTFAHGTIRVKSHGVASAPVAAPAVAVIALMPGGVGRVDDDLARPAGASRPASSAPPALTVGGVSSRPSRPR